MTRLVSVVAAVACLALVVAFRSDVAAAACAVWEFATCTFGRRMVSAFLIGTFAFVVLPIMALDSR